MLVSVFKAGNTVAGVVKTPKRTAQARKIFAERVITVETIMIRKNELITRPPIVSEGRRGDNLLHGSRSKKVFTFD